MTLINSLQKRALLATVVLCYRFFSICKRQTTLSGRIVNSDGKKVNKAMVTLLSGGEVVDEEKQAVMGSLNLKSWKKVIMCCKHHMTI